MDLEFQFELSESEKIQWAEFWNNCQHSHPRQHFLFGEIEFEKGRFPIYFSGEVDGNLVCTAIFSIRPLFFDKTFSLEAICLRGPVFDDVSFFQDLIRFAVDRFKALRVGSIRISPYWQFPEAEEVLSALKELGFTPYYKHRRVEATYVGSRTGTGRVDLTRSEDEILASFSKYTRRDIKRVAKLDIDVHPLQMMDEALLAFHSFCNMRRERGLTQMSKGEFRRTFEYFLADGDYGILFGAFSKKNFLGALWLIRGPQIALTAGYAVEPESCRKVHNSLSIGPPLWWEGIRWAKQKGCSWLDVEGYSETTPKSSPTYHIHEFKRKFRPLPIQIISEHVLVCNPMTYRFYKGCHFLRRGTRFAKSLAYQLRTRLCSPMD